MIEFHLDPRSGVATYLQIVQQVKEALRLGTIDVGDQLPTVREVVADLAINPNTVAKAYRDLEHEGLVVARQGRGTFVASTLAPASLRHHEELRAALERWLQTAERRARRGEHPGVDLRDPSRRWPDGWHEPGAPRRARPREALPSRVGAARLHAHDSARRDRRPGGAERGGQVDAPRARGRPACTNGGLDLRPRARPAARALGARRGRLRRTGRSAVPLVHRRRDDRVRAQDELPLGRRDRRRPPHPRRVADEGRLALRRRPRAARARARPRQAAAARAARRAVRPPRPARRTRVPPAADGRRRRDGRDGRDRVARDRGHRARLRPHRAADRRRRPARGQRREAARVAPDPDGPAPAARLDPRRPASRAGAPQRPPADAARAERRTDRRPVVDRRPGRPRRAAARVHGARAAAHRRPPERLPLRWHG